MSIVPRNMKPDFFLCHPFLSGEIVHAYSSISRLLCSVKGDYKIAETLLNESLSIVDAPSRNYCCAY